MIDEQTAIQIVQAHLASNGQQSWSYVVEGIRKHDDCWAVGVRPRNPKGEPCYDLMGFEVDLVSGKLSQWS